MTAVHTDADRPLSISPLPAVSIPVRLAAGLAGVLWLAAVSVALLGLPVLVALAVWGAAALLSRRGQVLRRGSAWLVAFFSAGVLFALVLIALLLSLPPAERARLLEPSVAPTTAQPELPDWLERMAQRSSRGGGAGGQPTSSQLAESRPFQLYIAIFTSVILVALLGAIVGTLSWIGAGLLRLGVRGAWFPPGERRPLPGDPVPASSDAVPSG